MAKVLPSTSITNKINTHLSNVEVQLYSLSSDLKAIRTYLNDNKI